MSSGQFVQKNRHCEEEHFLETAQSGMTCVAYVIAFVLKEGYSLNLLRDCYYYKRGIQGGVENVDKCVVVKIKKAGRTTVTASHQGLGFVSVPAF